MGLGVALTNALSGIKVNQEALSLVAQNIANAASVDYTRRTITQTTQVVNGVAAGAQIASVERAVDEFIAASARRQISSVSKAATLTDYFSRAELYLGQPGANNSLNSYVDDFFSSLTDLANSPEQIFLRSSVVDKGITLASRVSELATNLENLRFDADKEISTTIDSLNTLLSRTSAINAGIKENAILGGDLNALFDQRDSLLKEITGIIDVTLSFNENGEVTIFVPKGELLTPTQLYKVVYDPVTSVDSLINDDVINGISIYQVDEDGEIFPTSQVTLVSASDASRQEINFTSGKLKALLEIRDEEIPNILEQLDEFAKTIKDAFNAIHNDGAGFPPPEELTGSRLVNATDDYSFSGKMRIALVNQDGSPATSTYSTTEGLRPLTIDFDRLDGGSGTGTATVQTLIDEINHYFGAPPAQKATLGPLDDIRLAAVSDSITSTKASGTLAFVGNPAVGDTVTINGTVFTFIANGTASNGTNIELQSNVSATIAEVARYLSTYTGGVVDDVTYSASNGILTVTHKTSGTAPNGVFTLAGNVTNGGGTVKVNSGVAAATASGTMAGGAAVSGNFTFDFEFTNTSAETATIQLLGVTATGTAGQVGTFDTYSVAAGIRTRTAIDGVSNDSITIDFTGSALGEGGTQTVALQVLVTDGDGNTYTDTISFQITIPDPDDSIKNDRYSATAVSGSGDATLTAPVTSSLRFATALLVDEDGNAVADGEDGYLMIRTDRGDFGIVIDEMDGSEDGLVSDSTTATGFGISHFFGLNDFFEAGDTLKNSAVNMAVREDYQDDPSRIATSELVLSIQPTDSDADPVYTYEIGPGSNALANRLAGLKFATQSFDSAGTLPSISETFTQYASEIISFTAFRSNVASDSLEQETILFEAFNNKLEASGGVNIDEELANTVPLQNNYSASARMINIISELFDELLKSF